MKLKKLLLVGLSLLLCSTVSIQGVSAQEKVYIMQNDDGQVSLSDDEIQSLKHYNRIFIESGFINEFNLLGASLVCKTDLNMKIKEYAFNEADVEYIQHFLNYSQDEKVIQNTKINARITVKNWNIYLTSKEVKKYFGNVLTLGPVAIVGALTAIGSVGGPVGSIVAFVVGSANAAYIATVVKKAYKLNKGLKIGFGGISVY